VAVLTEMAALWWIRTLILFFICGPKFTKLCAHVGVIVVCSFS